MKIKKILFVLTSCSTLGDSGKPTGWWISEASHPWKALINAGYEIDYMSPLGGVAPKTGAVSTDVINREFLDNAEVKRKIANTLKPEDINIDNYAAIHFVGGHGAMWDFPDNADIAKITSKMWDKGCIVSAICHGVCGLLNVKIKKDEYLIKGKDLTSYTDQEEKIGGTCEVIPFFLQCELMLKGAKYHIAKPWSDNIQVFERLLTGQNPQSGLSLGSALVTLLNKYNF
ncbi:MAG: type 1 glutamine amidotransferase domain-containing protein [Bacteroidales bacterium]|nr:type 1 glutamine amidotransferase domain-containing protein [Bacteroidales bacterium]